MTDDDTDGIPNHMRLLQTYNARHFRRMLGDAATPIAMRDVFDIDDYGQMTIGDWGGYHVQILPMLYNDRLVLAPPGGWGYDYGWCYDKGGAAFLAAMVWDPQIEAEPVGYKKRATHRLRQPGELVGNGAAEDALYGEALISVLAELLGDRAQP